MLERVVLGEKEIMPTTIPSGIITTQIPIIVKYLTLCDELGIISTKSVGPHARWVPERAEAANPDPATHSYREPILHQYAPGSFVNAVGLTNPGAEEFAEQLKQAGFPDIIPKNKFLLTSIVASTPEEFAKVAKILAPYSNGLEINVSCPHVKGHGVLLGQDPVMVRDVAAAVRGAVSIPISVKLPPVGNIAEVGVAAMEGGASFLTLINTERGYSHILSNGFCGSSGRGLKPLGVRCVKDVSQAVGKKVFILAMGGIENAQDIRDYKKVGARGVGIGSALAGMNDNEVGEFFPTVIKDLENRTDNASKLLKEVDMTYHPVKITKRVDYADDFREFTVNRKIDAKPGQFIFAHLPEMKNEKPFSVFANHNLRLLIQSNGCFTDAFNELNPGQEFQVRGPYGKPIEINPNKHYTLVAGGCGVAGIRMAAKRIAIGSEGGERPDILIGAKDAYHLPDLYDLARYGNVRVATDDGSKGVHGNVSKLLETMDFRDNTRFVNCGPEPMLDAVLPFEQEIVGPENVIYAPEPIIRCGVGICGECIEKSEKRRSDGTRTCIEGPFIGYK